MKDLRYEIVYTAPLNSVARKIGYALKYSRTWLIRKKKKMNIVN